MQCNTSAYLRPSWVWMSSARPSLVWERPLSSCCQSCSSWSLWRMKLQPSSSAILASLRTRYGGPPPRPGAFICRVRLRCRSDAKRFVATVQICHEFERFSTYMPNVRVANFFGGFPIKQQIEQLKTNTPHAVVGTPGRLKQASRLLFFFLLSLMHFVNQCVDSAL